MEQLHQRIGERTARVGIRPWWTAAVPLLALCSACAWGPGMRMDEDAVRERGESQDGGVAFVELSAPVLEALRKEPTEAPREPDPLAGTAREYQYRVAPFDVLSVIVWDHPELTIPAGEFRSAEATGNPVNADGTMFYPHAGVVPVAGKTLPEIRELLTSRLSKVLERPQLDVKVAAFRGLKVTVSGEVKSPRSVPVSDVPLRALDAITLSEGVTPEADLRDVVLSRDGKAHRLNLQAVNEEGDLSQNWILKDGDVLHVPDRSQRRVFVLGEVKRPGARFLAKGRLTLADALADSEGLDLSTSNAAGIYVLRGDYERPKVFQLDATSPDALLLATGFPLRPYDVVFVSTHKLTQWNRIVEQVLPTIQAITQPALYLRGYIPIPAGTAAQ